MSPVVMVPKNWNFCFLPLTLTVCHYTYLFFRIYLSHANKPLALVASRPWLLPYQAETSELKSIAGTEYGACLSPCPWTVSHHRPCPPFAAAM